MRMRPSRTLPLFVAALAVAVVSVWPAPAAAQTPFVPYYGKNRIHYDKFNWNIYKTDHFEIYYYPGLESHLQEVASYAESAYQHISSVLKHDLADRVPLIVFRTESEFQEQNISGDELPEGVLAFSEPERDRVVLPIDQPSDQLYQLITHELTHIFEFDMIPRGLGLMNTLPLWMDEGLADYMAGAWNPLDLMQVRDAALTDNVPEMSQLESQPLAGRVPYSMGHAAFEFIESRWGLDGLRQFLFSLRKSAIGGGESAYEEALKLKPEDFDEQFDRYLKDRFKPFRDKERPNDYGRDLAPRPDKTPYVSVLSIEPSPTGDMLAAVVGNARDQELDVILLSAKDGQIIRNLTKGFDKDRGFEYIATAGGLRGNLVPWIAWGPSGDRIAYFARTEKEKTLIIQSVVSGKTVQRIDLKTVDEPESPAFSPDGETIAFAGLRHAVADIFTVNLKTGDVANVTNDAVAEYAPTYSPDGTTMVYTEHVSGNDKLFKMDLASGTKTQLTFGTHDDTGAKFYDDHTIVFTSTATDPNKPLPLAVAKNGEIPNVWTLDLQKNELQQWTDTATGNVSPVVLHQANGLKVAFITYYKGENGIHVITADKAITTVPSSDFGSPGPVIDFQAPISQTIVKSNIRKKGAWEKMSLAGRPPVNLGITSGGNFYGNTQLTFTDVLGDKEVSFLAQSVAQFRTTAFSYVNIERRLQYAVQAFSQDTFFYGQYQGALYDPVLAPYIDRNLAQAVQSQRGATAFAIYPFTRYSRVELSGGYIHLSESYNNSALQQSAIDYQNQVYGTSLFRNGSMLPLGVTFVKETTVFRDYGPVAGNTMRFGYDVSPGLSDSWLSRQTFDGDVRYYQRLAANGVLAFRLRGFKSIGRNPDFFYFGGNSELRGYDYLSFLGQQGFFGDAELRFPLVDAMLTPFGVVGGLRGVFFFNIGGASIYGQPFQLMSTKSVSFTPLTGYDVIDVYGDLAPRYGDPVNISGFRLVDGRASYGIGLESFLLGFPMHFDWSWRTLFNKNWENALFASQGGSSAFRKVKFSFWIGYDF
jgi:WD40-like Beta Propeller Repeat